MDKQTVRGPVIPPTEDAQKVAATRLSEAEILATTRHQKINLVWEYTQAYMAILVITTVLLSSTYIAITTKEDSKRDVALAFMIGLSNLVAGFYFGRTNHTRPTGASKDG